jgi:pimeloyl-ACP methyl ester carboxylesterase
MVGRVTLAVGAVLAALAALAASLAFRLDLSLADLKARHGGLVLSDASMFLSIGAGQAVHLRDQGKREGKALVLLHDANSSLHTFESWAASLGRHYRVVSLDLPGHGLTGRIPGADESPQAMLPVLDKVTDALSLRGFGLAGVGMGSELALRYAFAHPERVSELVLIAPQALPEPSAIVGKAPFLLRLASIPLAGKLARFANLKGFARTELKRAFHDDARVREEMVERQWLLLRRAGNRAALIARLSQRTVDDFGGSLPDIRMPVLILWGAEDEKALVKSAMRYQDALPQSALVVFEKAGHFVQEEAPVDSAAVVNAFLLGLPVADASRARAMRRVYGEVPPLPAMPIKPVEVRPLDPVRLKSP